jgi:phosphoribosylpyrophosphate synthetase
MGLERQRVYAKETLESIFAKKLCGHEVVRFNNGVSQIQIFKDHDDSDIQIIQKWGE